MENIKEIIKILKEKFVKFKQTILFTLGNLSSVLFFSLTGSIFIGGCIAFLSIILINTIKNIVNKNKWYDFNPTNLCSFSLGICIGCISSAIFVYV